MKNTLVTIIVLCSFFIIATSCNDKIELQKDFDFEVKVLPVPSSVSMNEQVEIRLELKSIGGSYDSTKYFMRYFQYEGKGILADENGTIFLPNDSYQVYKKPFRYYFTPTFGTSHNLQLFFYDTFMHEHVLQLNFSIIQDSINKY